MKRAEIGLLAALGLCVAVVYCRAALGPLGGIGPDQANYFAQATHIARGEPTEPDQHPLGYPLALVGLHRIGLDSVRGVIGLNMVSLAVACACSWYLLRRDFGLTAPEAVPVMLLTLAAGPCVGNAISPLSDMCYFGASLLALFCLHQFVVTRSWMLFFGGLVCAAAAIEMRTTGCALAAAVVTALYLTFRSRIARWMIVAMVIIAAPAAAFALSGKQYVQFANGQYAIAYGSPINAVIQLAQIRLKVLGELVTHCSVFSVPLVYREEFTLLGALVCVVLAIGAWTLRKHLTPLTAYLALYSLITLIWPWVDDRFWIGVLPFLIAILLMGLKEIGRRATGDQKVGRHLLLIYTYAFVLWWYWGCIHIPNYHDDRADVAIASLKASP